MIALTALLARKDTIKNEARLVDLAGSLQSLAEAEKAFKEAGLHDGRFEFTEDSDAGNLYGLSVNVRQPTSGRSVEEMRQAITAAVDLRELADAVTLSGEGEFFSVEINLASFRADWIEPLQKQLVEAGVVVDI